MQLKRCTPLLLVGFLLFAIGCGDEKVAPASGPAGLVISVEGEVSAKRPNEVARTLKTNDTVFADDTLRTGDNSALEVELSHNGALWQLGANYERRVDASAAWRASKRSVGALDNRERLKTAAAGRNTTREAAESTATLLQGAPEATAQAAKNVATPARRGLRAKAKDAPTPPPPPAQPNPDPISPSASQMRQAESAHAQPGGPATNVRAAPIRETSAAAMDMDEESAFAEEEDEESAAAEEDSQAPAVVETSKQRVLELARKCRQAHKGKGRLRVALRVVKGRAKGISVQGPKELSKRKACLQRALRKATLPTEGKISLEIPST